jgi:hypothetical protein
MKKMQTLLLSSVLCLALAGLAVAEEAEVYSVGDFAVSLAKMVTNKADYTPEEAVAYLQKLGVELEGDLGSQVDQKQFVEAFDRLGVSLAASNPDRPMGEQDAGRVFRMFDRNDSLFSSELYKLCNVAGDGTDEPRPCVTDADCEGGSKCKVVVSIKCDGGTNNNMGCMSDADCPGGTCRIPPGQAKKIFIASPDD